MTKHAEKLLAAAREHIARGEHFYRKAAAEIEAAMEADPALTWKQVGEHLGCNDTWAKDIVTWAHNAAEGSPSTPRHESSRKAHTKRVLREASPEEIAEIVASLPDDAVTKVSKAVSSHYQERGEKAKQESAKRLREDLGDHVADGLLEEQRLRDAESKYFDARRSIRDGMVLLNDCDLDAMPDAWREDFLKTVDDLAQRLEITRSLLTGTLDEDIQAFLSEAGQ